jgi:hypothetical protein
MISATNNSSLTVYIEGIGLLGPGLAGWPSGRVILAGTQTYESHQTLIPPPELLPAAERRRASDIVKLTLATSSEAVAMAKREAANLPSVFSFSNGDGVNCHTLCEMLASNDRQISPTRFHNSVHNAAAGYWSIAMGAMATSSVLCAYDASFGAGLLEAMTQVAVDHTCCVLMTSDTTYPEPMRSKRPIPDNFGIALVLAPEPSARAIASITLTLTHDAADKLENAALETLRLAIPSARGLPLLRAVAVEKPAHVVLDYLDDMRLALEVAPC